MDLESAIVKAAEQLGYYPLKDEQMSCISEFLKGKDVFAVLPTGFGKSVCYSCLPLASDFYNEKTGSIIVVVSPLTALIQDQVANLTKRGMKAGYLDVESNDEAKSNVESGHYNIVFMSPELIVGKWRSLFSNSVYQKKLIGIIIDEAHCVLKWGLSFREAFLRIGEIRSLLSSNHHIMAVTATATSTLRNDVQKQLGMINPFIIVRSPDKVNIRYANVRIKAGDWEKEFKPLVSELLIKRILFPRVIIYCKKKLDCAKLYTYFQVSMGSKFTEPPGASDRIVECRLVDMFFAGTESVVKDRIITNFTKPSTLRIVIATTAFGLGIDCHDVRLVIHLGPPSDIETFVQGIGRAGRDGLTSYAILFHSASLSTHSSKDMIKFVENTQACRRDFLFSSFDNFNNAPINTGCQCCDVCMHKCSCGNCKQQLTNDYDFIYNFFDQ